VAAFNMRERNSGVFVKRIVEMVKEGAKRHN
jgi:hypothetical protein